MREGLLYERVYLDLLYKIEGGSYGEGDRLPTEKELSEYYGVSRITMKKAISILVEKGIVVRKPGIGTFVKSHSTGEEPAVRNEQITSPTGISKMGRGQMQQTVGGKRRIACIAEDVSDAFGISALRAITYYARQAGYDLILNLSLNSQSLEAEEIEFVKNAGAEGLIIFPAMGSSYNKELLRAVVEDYPIVTINRALNGIPASSVGIDHGRAAYDLISGFYERGHKKIGILGEAPEEGTGLEERYKGFKAAAKRYGCLDELVFYYEWKECSGEKNDRSPQTKCEEDLAAYQKEYALYEKFLQEFSSCTGFIGCNFGRGQMMRQMICKKGKVIPKDISIACFDDIGYECGDISLTHVYQPENQIAKKALELLEERISDQNTPPRNIILDYCINDCGTIGKI